MLSPGHSVEAGRRLFAPYGMTDLVWRGCSGAWEGVVGMGHLSQCFDLALSLWGSCSGAGAVPLRQLGQSSPLSPALCFSSPFCSPGPRKGQGIATICSRPGTWEHSFRVSLGSAWFTPHPCSVSCPLENADLFNSAASCAPLLPTASVTPTAHVSPVSYPLICQGKAGPGRYPNQKVEGT